MLVLLKTACGCTREYDVGDPADIFEIIIPINVGRPGHADAARYVVAEPRVVTEARHILQRRFRRDGEQAGQAVYREVIA